MHQGGRPPPARLPLNSDEPRFDLEHDYQEILTAKLVGIFEHVIGLLTFKYGHCSYKLTSVV